MGLLEKIRRWIDSEEAETALEDAIRESEKNPASPSEEFIVRVARAVEEVMRREMIRLPQGTVLIPSEYVVFMSEEDDLEWRGKKRKSLEEAVYYILGKKANELAEGRKLEIKRLVIDLKVDGSLEKGAIRVQHTWEDGASGQTSVFARQSATSKPKNALNIETRVKQQWQQESTELPKTFVSEHLEPTTVISSPLELEEATRIAKRNVELYRLEIWRNGVRQSVLPIYQPQIVVGRGSRSMPVDVALQGDLEISRQHLKMIYENGNIYVIAEGKNPTFVDDKEIPARHKIRIMPGAIIKVCSYLLRVQFPRIEGR